MARRKPATRGKNLNNRKAAVDASPATPQITTGQVDCSKCVGCDTVNTTLVPLPRDTNPKELFSKYEKDKSRACISCAYHAILVRQVRDAMSYKLDGYQHPKQCCLVCNSTTGLVPMSAIKGAKEAVVHPIINAQNVDQYLQVPCSLCTCCAYPLQWLYEKVLMPPHKSTPTKSVIKPTSKSKASGKVKVEPTEREEEETDEESEEDCKEEIPRLTRNRIIHNPRTSSKSRLKSSAQKIAIRGQTKSTKRVVASKPAPLGKKMAAKSLNKDFWSEKQPELTTTRTRQKASPPKRKSVEVKTSPAKKSKVSLRITESPRRTTAKVLTPAAKKAMPPVKKTPVSQKKKPVRPPRPCLSPPPSRANSRRRTEMQERVCETCQQIFYSGTELALHELRHTGKSLRISLDKFEIPEPVQSLQQSYLFQDPVRLTGPNSKDDRSQPREFDFDLPLILEIASNIDEPIQAPVNIFEDEPKEVMENEDSNAETDRAVENIIDSLAEDNDERGSEKTEEKEVPAEKEKFISSLSFDYFAPSSPKPEVAKNVNNCLSFDFFGPADPPGLKTPPPSTASSLSFDFFAAPDTSPSKDCSMFSSPPVDPARALKPNSENPSLPLPSDSDNSLILTPPKEGLRHSVDMEKLEKAVGDS